MYSHTHPAYGYSSGFPAGMNGGQGWGQAEYGGQAQAIMQDPHAHQQMGHMGFGGAIPQQQPAAIHAQPTVQGAPPPPAPTPPPQDPELARRIEQTADEFAAMDPGHAKDAEIRLIQAKEQDWVGDPTSHNMLYFRWRMHYTRAGIPRQRAEVMANIHQQLMNGMSPSGTIAAANAQAAAKQYDPEEKPNYHSECGKPDSLSTEAIDELLKLLDRLDEASAIRNVRNWLIERKESTVQWTRTIMKRLCYHREWGDEQKMQCLYLFSDVLNHSFKEKEIDVLDGVRDLLPQLFAVLADRQSQENLKKIENILRMWGDKAMFEDDFLASLEAASKNPAPLVAQFRASCSDTRKPRRKFGASAAESLPAAPTPQPAANTDMEASSQIYGEQASSMYGEQAINRNMMNNYGPAAMGYGVSGWGMPQQNYPPQFYPSNQGLIAAPGQMEEYDEEAEADEAARRAAQQKEAREQKIRAREKDPNTTVENMPVGLLIQLQYRAGSSYTSLNPAWLPPVGPPSGYSRKKDMPEWMCDNVEEFYRALYPNFGVATEKNTTDFDLDRPPTKKEKAKDTFGAKRIRPQSSSDNDEPIIKRRSAVGIAPTPKEITRPTFMPSGFSSSPSPPKDDGSAPPSSGSRRAGLGSDTHGDGDPFAEYRKRASSSKKLYMSRM